MADERRFVSDPLVYGNAERYLQLAIQAVLDVSNHIVADMDVTLPADNRELFDLLAKRKMVPVGLARRLGPGQRCWCRVRLPDNRRRGRRLFRP